MGLGYREWTDSAVSLEMIEDTLGGDTYVFNGQRVCYAFLKSHHRAIRALLDGEKEGRGTDWEEIQDDVVSRLIEDGVVIVNTSHCLPETGYLGAEVWDGNSEYIGTIGERCSQEAGWGTEHLGYGRCRFHGGAAVVTRMMNNMQSGLQSKHLRAQVASKIGKFMDDPMPLDLSKEIATQRALLELLLEYVVNRGDIDFFMNKVPGLVELIDSIGNMVNRAALVEKRYAMTAAQVLYVQSVFVDIINSYIPSPAVREQVAAELRRRLGTGAREVNLATQSAYLVGSTVESG